MYRDQTYYPTTPLTPEQLAKYSHRAETQTEIILDIFTRHPYTELSAEDIQYMVGGEMLLTSVRRALTGLRKSHEIEQVGAKPGYYNRPILTYRRVPQ